MASNGMNPPLTIGPVLGGIRFHLSWPLFPAGVAAYSLALVSGTEAALYVLVLLCVYLAVLVHAGTECLAARRFRLGTRDATLYPFWIVARPGRMSDRPWEEKYVAATGMTILAAIVATVGVGLALAAGGIPLPEAPAEITVDAFLSRLFWALSLLAAAHLLPVLPFDGGRMLRASLAMRSSRLRATEIVAHLSTVAAGLLLVVAILWLKSPFLGVTAVLIFLGAQEELGTVRYFERLRPALEHRRPATMAPFDQIVTPDCRPGESDFSGFTWNADAGLWIEWRAGRPVAANALIGDGRP